MVLGLLWCNVGVAAITADGFLKAMASGNAEVRELIKNNLIGINSGFMYSNVELKYMKKELIYCQPTLLRLNGDNLIDAVNDSIRHEKDKGNYIGEVPIGMMLMMHFKRVFPCN